MDILTPEQRHFNMSQIHSKDTKPELIVRKWLWHHGYRYRLHGKDLPGKPDIILPKYKSVIFVHGCFWHRHNCKYASKPKTNKEFWNKKLNGNVKRDKKNIKKLVDTGWRVLVIWECEIKKWDIKLDKKLSQFLNPKIIRYKKTFTYNSYIEDFKYVAENEAKYQSPANLRPKPHT
jgi:DNA mismatch endonuclease (patch repair protein)